MSRTAPLYLRLPAELKEHVDQYADEAETSLTVAVAELVGVGLRNSDSAIEVLRDRIRALEGEVAALQTQRASATTELGTLRDDVARNRRLIESVMNRLNSPVGVCPICSAPVTGRLVFVDGACPAGHNLQASVVEQASKTGLNSADLLAALAVVGVALGVAVMVNKA